MERVEPETVTSASMSAPGVPSPIGVPTRRSSRSDSVAPVTDSEPSPPYRPTSRSRASAVPAAMSAVPPLSMIATSPSVGRVPVSQFDVANQSSVPGSSHV